MLFSLNSKLLNNMESGWITPVSAQTGKVFHFENYCQNIPRLPRFMKGILGLIFKTSEKYNARN